MVAQADPELTFHGHTESIPVYKADPPEEDLKVDKTACAQ